MTPAKDATLKKHQILYKIEQEGKIVAYKERRLFHNIRLHHKFIFGTLVFFGMMLLWVGGFALISEIPFLSNPFVSLAAGVVLLLSLGYFYKNVL